MRHDLRDLRSGASHSQGSVFGRRQFHDLHPLNTRRLWLSNRVIARRVVPELAGLVEDGYCVLSRAAEHAEGLSVVRLREFPEDVSADVSGIMEIVHLRGNVRIVPLRWDRGPGVILEADSSGTLLLGGRAVSRDELTEALVEICSRTRCVIINSTERARLLPDHTPDDTIIRMYIGRSDDAARVLDAEMLAHDALKLAVPDDKRSVSRGSFLRRPPFFALDHARSRFAVRVPLSLDTGAPVGGDGDPLAGFAGAVRHIERVLSDRSCRFVFISVDVAVGADGRYRIVDIAANPVHPGARSFDQPAEQFLLAKWIETQRDRSARAASVSVRRRVRRGVTRGAWRVRAFRLRALGFTGPAAREWNRVQLKDRRRHVLPKRHARRAHEWGFDASTVSRFGITEANRSSFLSRREYLYAQPLNGKYAKWVRDRVSALMVFHPFAHNFASTHFQIYRRSRGVHLVPLSGEATALGAHLEAMAQVLQRHGELELRRTRWRTGTVARVAHDGASFVVNDVACTPGEFYELLANYTRRSSLVLVEGRGSDRSFQRLSVTMMNPAGNDPRPVEALLHLRAELPGDEDGQRATTLFASIDPATAAYRGARRVIRDELREFRTDPSTGAEIVGEVAGWAEMLASLEEMCRFAPQLRYMQFTLNLFDEGFEIQRIAEKPTLSREFPLTREATEFIKAQAAEKHRRRSHLRARVSRGAHNARLKIRREFAKALYPKGLLPYQSVRWLGDMRRDLLERNGVSLKTKLWAYRNGFLSYRIPQYGITPQNRLGFISDFEYRWLRHINTRYKYWLEDKISIKYVASEFNQFLPGYYYTTSASGGTNHLIPMMDCPDGYGASFDDVLRLAREKGVLALKPDEGSHGDGFYRLGYENEGFTLNGESAGEDEVLAILKNPDNRYLVTEFIVMHPTLAEIYPTSVNTIRMIVFKKDAVTPELGNAYLRIGTAASGFVDNTAAGGLLAQIDVDTGRFGEAKSLRNGRVVDTPNHPDTGVFIGGTIPNWELVKEQVLRMAASFSQLEYLGFDVAITEDGFKIPEINRFPDFPRIDRLTPETIDYLLMKLDDKKREYGYHRRRPRTLISLPRREQA